MKKHFLFFSLLPFVALATQAQPLAEAGEKITGDSILVADTLMAADTLMDEGEPVIDTVAEAQDLIPTLYSNGEAIDLTDTFAVATGKTDTASTLNTVSSVNDTTATTSTVKAADKLSTLPVVHPSATVSDTADIYELNSPTALEEEKPLPEIRDITIGVMGGLGMSYYRSTPSNNRTAFVGRVGVNFDIPFGQWFSLNPSLEFATRGGGYTESGAARDYDFKENLYYFDLPINLKFSTRYNLSQKITGRPFVSVAPVLSLGLYADGDCSGSSYHPFQNDTEKEFQHSFYGNFDFSLNFRIGYDFDKHYTIALAYQLGLTDLVNDDLNAGEKQYYESIHNNSLPSVHNNSIYITFGYNW